MKRFISDMLLILFMVGIGSGLREPAMMDTVNYSIEEFERKVELHEIIDSQDSSQQVLHIDGNKASDLALSTSLAIEEGVRIIVEFVTTLFASVVN